jgi:predicted RNase H-like nuclease (RuvC/YqgF family)
MSKICVNIIPGVFVAKSSKKFNVVYPEEREGREKDSNRKLRNQIKSLNKKISQLESENRTLKRAFNKTIDFTEKKLKNHKIEEVQELVDDFDFKETRKGRQKQGISKENKEEQVKKQEVCCPECGRNAEKGFKVMDFGGFCVESCVCDYRSRKNKSEGMERS